MEPLSRKLYMQTLKEQEQSERTAGMLAIMSIEKRKEFMKDFGEDERVFFEGMMLLESDNQTRCEYLHNLAPHLRTAVQERMLSLLPPEEWPPYFQTAMKVGGVQEGLISPAEIDTFFKGLSREKRFEVEGDFLSAMSSFYRAMYLGNFTQAAIKDKEAMMLSAMPQDQKAAYLYTLPHERSAIEGVQEELACSPKERIRRRAMRLEELSHVTMHMSRDRALEEGRMLLQSTERQRQQYFDALTIMAFCCCGYLEQRGSGTCI
jgi:hypothetical protein